MVQPLWKTLQQFLKKLSIYVLHNLAILDFGDYPRQMRAHIKTCIQLLIAALFVIVLK